MDFAPQIPVTKNSLDDGARSANGTLLKQHGVKHLRLGAGGGITLFVTFRVMDIR